MITIGKVWQFEYYKLPIFFAAFRSDQTDDRVPFVSKGGWFRRQKSFALLLKEAKQDGKSLTCYPLLYLVSANLLAEVEIYASCVNPSPHMVPHIAETDFIN